MKKPAFIIAASLTLWMMVLTGVAAAADTGAGVCVLGVGFDTNADTGPGPFVGINVADPTLGNSETGAYDNNEDFEAQCCAETGQPPDCFAPVE